jgi:hypothetical protein
MIESVESEERVEEVRSIFLIESLISFELGVESIDPISHGFLFLLIAGSNILG